jgi:hypothetical protein
MRFCIVLKSSGYVVRKFSSDSKCKAEVVYGNFLKEYVKDDCFNSFF